jgi:hypothetical protein
MKSDKTIDPIVRTAAICFASWQREHIRDFPIRSSGFRTEVGIGHISESTIYVLGKTSKCPGYDV